MKINYKTMLRNVQNARGKRVENCHKKIRRILRKNMHMTEKPMSL